MEKNINKKIYLKNHDTFFDKIIVKNRLKMVNLIENHFNDEELDDVLDIGSTNDFENESSNFLIKNLKNFKNYKSISDQKIELSFFSKALKKSITENFSDLELEEYKSDVVISNATIEHVGSLENQIKMCENIIKLSKKYFIVITPNRYHPVEFHSKLPLLHWLPNRLFARILKILGFEFFSKEENLNLLSKKQLNKLTFRLTDSFEFKIYFVRLFFFKSNFIVIGNKK